MISAELTITYVGPSGRHFSTAPKSTKLQTGWQKQWLLEVDVDGGRYSSEHREILANGRAEEPTFNEYTKEALARNIANMIGDVINNQI